MFREYDIARLFETVFGYKPKPYESSQMVTAKKQFSSSISGLADYYDTYQDFGSSGGREIFLPIWLNDYMLPFAVVDISNKKNIVETPMIHRQGTVKELISIEDVKIGVKGIIIREDGLYPDQEIQQLKFMYDFNEAISIKNLLTDIFLLEIGAKKPPQVVITDLKFPATVGVKNAKAYEMSLVSDRIFDLYVAPAP